MRVSRDQRLVIALGILLFTTVCGFAAVVEEAGVGGLPFAAIFFLLGTVIAAAIAPDGSAGGGPAA